MDWLIELLELNPTQTRRGLLEALADNPAVEPAYPTNGTYLPDVVRMDRPDPGDGRQ